MHDPTTPELLDRETVMLAPAAAEVLGVQHRVTWVLAQAALTMTQVDLWHARLALKTLRRDQREAITAAAED